MGMKLIKVQVSKRSIYSYIHRTDESDPTTQTLYTQAQVDEIPDAEIHEFEGSYLDTAKKADEERVWRDEALRQSDLLALQASMGELGRNLQAVKAYRQALRDYPQQSDFPNGERPKP